MKNCSKIRFALAFMTFFFACFSSYSQEIDESPEEIVNTNSSFSEEGALVSLDKIDQSSFYQVAVIQALNKITAKTSLLEIRINEETKFGKLTIVARKCWKSSPEQRPDSKILMEVYENSSESKDAKKGERIFYGWMISSSPSISSLEHPIYDITAINCKK